MTADQARYPSAGTFGATRPMTAGERDAVQGIPRSLRSNAVGISILSMVMAVMVNFVDEPIALLMPLVFCFIGLGLAVQARKSSGSVAQAVARGAVVDVRGAPRWKGTTGGWDFGPFSVVSDAQLKGPLADGVTATVTVVPEAKRVLSVNGVPLKKPVELRPGPGFDGTMDVGGASPAYPQAPTSSDQDIPPPPDGWAPDMCPQCGQVISGRAMFCERCGLRLRT